MCNLQYNRGKHMMRCIMYKACIHFKCKITSRNLFEEINVLYYNILTSSCSINYLVNILTFEKLY